MTSDLATAEVWGTLAAGAAVVGAVWAAVRKVVPTLRKLGHLADDLLGEPARPGVDARPGLMERVAAVETGLAAVKHEVEHNDGSSLKDATRRTEHAVRDLHKRVDTLADREPPTVQQDITIHPHDP